jgi:hypothetical protein
VRAKRLAACDRLKESETRAAMSIYEFGEHLASMSVKRNRAGCW